MISGARGWLGRARVLRAETELGASAQEVFDLLADPETERGLLEGWLSVRGSLPAALEKDQGFSPRLWFMGKVPMWRQHLNVAKIDRDNLTLLWHSEGGPFAQWDHQIRVRSLPALAERSAGERPAERSRLIEEIEVTPKHWSLALWVREAAWFYLRFRQYRLNRIIERDRGLSLKIRGSKTVTLGSCVWGIILSLSLLASAGALSGCASTPKGLRKLHGVGIFHLKIRRPTGKGADPQAGPGGNDYRSESEVGQNLDCKSSNELFSQIHLSELKGCLELMKTDLKDELDVEYRLTRSDEPTLDLVQTKNTPECLKAALPQIPVPREIFFQSDEEGAPGCYSSRLPIEADKVLGRKMPIARVNLLVQLPIADVPQSDHDLVNLLKTWVLSLFFTNTEPRTVSAWIVPRSLCAQCFGGYDELVKPHDPPPTLWPPRHE